MIKKVKIINIIIPYPAAVPYTRIQIIFKTKYSYDDGIIHHFTGEKCLRMRHDKNHVVDFRQSHWLIEAKSPRNVVKMKEEMAAFFVCGSVVGQFVATRKLFWSKFLVICVV